MGYSGVVVKSLSQQNYKKSEEISFHSMNDFMPRFLHRITAEGGTSDRPGRGDFSLPSSKG